MTQLKDFYNFFDKIFPILSVQNFVSDGVEYE